MKKKHILLIDDDEDEMDFFVLAQNKMKDDFMCSYLGNASEAVKKINELKPDIVFLDMNMPGINGLECLEEINKSKVHPDLYVVFYSTGMDNAACKKAIALGAAGCIKKPVDISAFREILQDVLAKS